MAAPKRGDKPSNLYATRVPGGTDESGRKFIAGTAKWWRPDELPPRRKRQLDVIGTQFGGALQRAVEHDRQRAQAEIERRATLSPEARAAAENAQTGTGTIVASSGAAVTDAELAIIASIDPDDVSAMFELNDTAAWAYLREWTVQVEITVQEGEGTVTRREPAPLPADVSELLDLPREIYDALLEASGKIYAEQKAAENAGTAAGFTAASVANPASPTGGSAG
ncbi:MAG: hypothetical protein AB7T06_24735 [Kofleriaceae bacterium]